MEGRSRIGVEAGMIREKTEMWLLQQTKNRTSPSSDPRHGDQCVYCLEVYSFTSLKDVLFKVSLGLPFLFFHIHSTEVLL